MDHLKIIIENANGQHHMDRDIKLFDLYEKSDLSPTLCLYSWNKPCISLGYSQSIDEEIDPDIANNLGWDVVRRPTGGGIVFHNTSEITYSFFSQIDNPAIPKGLISSYKKYPNASFLA